MAQFYRYRLPPWLRQWILVIESWMIPICVFQGIRTLLFPTTFDVILLFLLLGLYICFYLKWI
ncbi:hypothetical protein J2T56_000978 [Natronobacillus azotifigens]|uniref:Uncharacterized protein n=1 Tax=Natronobacillus azotifigens TaxID=472978 RepID=A0A9J6RB04_9BACI|nr:hypothetical protein [Natronobacillus azotifigens]MCZ0702417.1 hypothetical protein [Natronobacillus azotifigens]